MQRGLPVKEHNVAILQVTLHFVAWLQVDIAVLAPVAQVKALPVLPDDKASPSLARRWVGTVLHQLLQPAEAVLENFSKSRQSCRNMNTKCTLLGEVEVSRLLQCLLAMQAVHGDKHVEMLIAGVGCAGRKG